MQNAAPGSIGRDRFQLLGMTSAINADFVGGAVGLRRAEGSAQLRARAQSAPNAGQEAEIDVALIFNI